MIEFAEYFFILARSLVFGFSPVILLYLFLWLCCEICLWCSVRLLGIRTVLATGFVGVPVHELAHLLMCIVFRHRVVDVQLYQSRSDIRGYVRHTYNPSSLYQRIGLFFIGLAPFYVGFILLWWLSDHYLGVDVLDISDRGLSYFAQALGMLEQQFASLIAMKWYGVLYVLIAASVILNMMPSRQDFRGASEGFVFLFLLYFIVVSGIIVAGNDLNSFTLTVYNWSYKLAVNLAMLFVLMLMLLGIIVSAGVTFRVLSSVVSFWVTKRLSNLPEGYGK